MIHCANYKIKCHKNPYRWCSSKQCPYYKYNGIWNEEYMEEDYGREEQRELSDRVW